MSTFGRHQRQIADVVGDGLDGGSHPVLVGQHCAPRVGVRVGRREDSTVAEGRRQDPLLDLGQLFQLLWPHLWPRLGEVPEDHGGLAGLCDGEQHIAQACGTGVVDQHRVESAPGGPEGVHGADDHRFGLPPPRFVLAAQLVTVFTDPPQSFLEPSPQRGPVLAALA